MRRGSSLAELRDRYRSRLPGAATLEALRADPRAGVRALAEQLARRRSALDRERARIARLYRAERALSSDPGARIAGVDEVGMGPLAGPVVAAAVILPARPRLDDLDDSKRLRPEVRERVADAVRELALDVGIGVACREEIDRLNIFQAGLLAMRRAIEALATPPDLVAIDGRQVPDLSIAQAKCIGGDARIACIAAASVVAKQHRDRWMEDLDGRFPGYGFARNAGYGTPEHLRALALHGPTPEHRVSFAPVRSCTRPAGEVTPCPTW